MRTRGGWSTRELAEIAGTTLKTVRYYHEIELLEEPSRSAKKIKSGVTDTGREILYDEENKPGISNLLTVYAAGTWVASLCNPRDGETGSTTPMSQSGAAQLARVADANGGKPLKTIPVCKQPRTGGWVKITDV